MIQTVEDPALSEAVASVPPGAWAVGVSGGADSVALMMLLRRRPDLSLTVVHLNHEARGAASDADAEFVKQLAARWELPSVIARWRTWESLLRDPPKNRSARFRAGRIVLFQQVVRLQRLQGVILGHHADDVAETVLQRLLRGGGATSLAALRPQSVIGGMLVLRPLLHVRRDALRRWLVDQGQAWREDESNASPRYQRNRLRTLLATRPELTEALLEVADACAGLREWVRRHAPQATSPLPVAALRDLPTPLAMETARRWLASRGAPQAELTTTVLKRLVEMAADAASPTRQHFPGGVLVRRRGGVLVVDGAAGDSQHGR
jgi:tRNA(Ile)-lysidine synthetase-like protein